MKHLGNQVKHLLIILSLLLLNSPLFGQSEETCYVVVDSSEEFNPTLLSNISVSIISQFLREVEPIPPEGVSMDSCLYQISVSKEQDTTFVTFKGKNLNSYGDSKLSGTDGFQQSLLKSLYRSLSDKRKLICDGYGELIVKCGSVVVQDVPKKVEPKVVETKVPTPKTETNLKIEQKVSKTVEGILFKDLFGGWKPVGNKNRPTERKYEGGIRDGLPNGQGTFIDLGGNRIVGEWRDGEPWNTTVYKPNGFKSGEYKNGVFTFQ